MTSREDCGAKTVWGSGRETLSTSSGGHRGIHTSRVGVVPSRRTCWVRGSFAEVWSK